MPVTVGAPSTGGRDTRSWFTSVRSRAPWGLIAMIGLVIAIESAVGRNWLDFSDPVSLSWRFSAQGVESKAAAGQVLCLGDSLVKHGLIPSVIEAETGRSTQNLSAARGSTLLTYFLLRRALALGAHPDAVIINAKPAVLIGGPDYNARYFEEILSARECLELAQITRRASLMASILAGRLLPSLRGRLEIRSHIVAALRGKTDPLHDINRTLWRNWTVNAGANVTSTNGRGTITAESIKHLYPTAFHIDHVNALAIERLMELASSHGVPVYWLLPPLPSSLQALRDASGSEAAYERFVRSVQSRYPQTMTVLDARRAAYSPDCFVDATHLNSKGAIPLSRAVARAIDPGRSAAATHAGWIKLEDHLKVAGTLSVALENVEQSKKILGFEGAH